MTIKHAGETFAGLNKPKRSNKDGKSQAVLIKENGKRRI